MPVLLKNVILSYPSLFHKAEFNGEEQKYQTSVIIEKDSANYKALKAEYDKVCKAAVESKKLTKSQLTPWFKPAAGTKGIVTDCEEDPEKFEDDRFLNAVVATPKNGNRPVVVDGHNQPIYEDDNEIYGGVVCNVNVTVYAYSKTYKGIGLQLNGVQKVKDADPFGAPRMTADDMFGVIDEDSMYD